MHRPRAACRPGPLQARGNGLRTGLVRRVGAGLGAAGQHSRHPVGNITAQSPMRSCTARLAIAGPAKPHSLSRRCPRQLPKCWLALSTGFPCIDPPHHLQVELVRRSRGRGPNAVQRGIHSQLKINNGIATGLRTAGGLNIYWLRRVSIDLGVVCRLSNFVLLFCACYVSFPDFLRRKCFRLSGIRNIFSPRLREEVIN